MTRSDRVESQAIGSYLRWQRELREISVDELAQLTRVPVRSIERLESGLFDGQVDGFVKGFVRTVSDSLGLDAEDTLSRMHSEPEPEDGRLVNLKRRVAGALLGLAVVSLLVALLFVVQQMSTRQSRSAAEADQGLIFRRDPVRALAEPQVEPGFGASPMSRQVNSASESDATD